MYRLELPSSKINKSLCFRTMIGYYHTRLLWIYYLQSKVNHVSINGGYPCHVAWTMHDLLANQFNWNATIAIIITVNLSSSQRSTLTAFISVGVYSLSMVVSFGPFCICTSLLPSKVQMLFTFLPSAVSSSNSSLSLNLISVFLKGLVVFRVYTPSFSVNSTTGLTLLAILRVTIPTPGRKRVCTS